MALTQEYVHGLRRAELNRTLISSRQNTCHIPNKVAQLVGVSYTKMKVVGLIPSQALYRRQQSNVSLTSVSLSLSPPTPSSPCKINKHIFWRGLKKTCHMLKSLWLPSLCLNICSIAKKNYHFPYSFQVKRNISVL